MSGDFFTMTVWTLCPVQSGCSKYKTSVVSFLLCMSYHADITLTCFCIYIIQYIIWKLYNLKAKYLLMGSMFLNKTQDLVSYDISLSKV